MIKKILFVATIFVAGAVTGQNLTITDANNNSIDGLTYYIYDTGINLSETKLHIANSSGAAINFDGSLTEITNPKGEDWQLCFGMTCFPVPAGIPTAQVFSDVAAISPASGFYNDFKVGPSSWDWVAGDFGKWRVRVINTQDVNDFSEACIVWTVDGTFAGDQNSNMVMDGSELAGDVDLDGTINGSEVLGDMDGSGRIDPCEVAGDANGNGIIDNGEVLSVVDFDEKNVGLNVYPNPVSTQLNISYSIEGSVNNARVDVYDVLGQKINTYKLNNNKGQLNIDVEHLNSGVYFYTIKVNEKMIRTERVMVK